MHVTVRVTISGTKSVFRILSEKSLLRRITNRKMSTKFSPYGSWASPISSKLVSESSVGFQEVHVDNHPNNTDTVYWSELRFDEGGRYVVCSQKGGEKFVSWTPKDFNARTRVHEYGGGAFFVYNNSVYFSNFKDQCMYLQKNMESDAVPISPEDSQWRYADGQFHHKTGKIYCVREDHSVISQTVKQPTNTVVVIDPTSQNQNILASGCDFYSSPRVSPDGKQIAWVQWNHPNMPWDDTELWTADLNEAGTSVVQDSQKKVAGGENISVMHPSWTADNQLLYISDKTNWWNLYHMTSNGDHVNLLPRNCEIGSPHWIFGTAPYSIDRSGSGKVAVVVGNELGLLDMNTKQYCKIDTGFTVHTYINLSPNGDIYCCAGSPTRFSCIIRIESGTDKVTILRESKSTTVGSDYFSIPENVTWDTTDGDVSHGYFYPPKNKDFQASPDTLPPLLVKAHGGPTGNASNVLNLKIQYFTSRGFAVLDVNYRGSTGYGRIYRNKLRKRWGICDVEDCCSGATYFAKNKKVDGNKLCIDGGSAGGYTTLACLTFKDDFKAGASHYGVADLEALAADTHKFESRYLDTMIGPYSGDGIQVYKDRSPINFVEKISCPVAFFQGDEDKIVPPNQAQMMYDAVNAKKLPTMYILFKGEQHGFRKSENIQTALDGEFYFFSKVFGFEAADKHCQLPISNL